MKLFLIFSAFLALCNLSAQNKEKDIANRTWDKLDYDGKTLTAGELYRPLSKQEIQRRSKNQLVLCMIGDSVTWAQDGDYFLSVASEAAKKVDTCPCRLENLANFYENPPFLA